MLMGMDNTNERTDSGFEKWLKTSDDAICYDKLMTYEKRIFRAQRALNGMLKNAIGGNFSANLNETLTEKGKAYLSMFNNECSNGKCTEALDSLIGALNGKSGNMNGCDIPTMLVQEGEFGAATQVHEVCNRFTMTARSAQIVNIINNAITVTSAYFVFKTPDDFVQKAIFEEMYIKDYAAMLTRLL